MSRGESPHLPSWVQSPMPVALRSNALISRSNPRMPDVPGAASIPSASPAEDFDVASLLAGARDGDQGSLGELLSHYRKYLLVLATAQIEKRLAPRVSPSDIVQETMLKAQRHLAQFRGQIGKRVPRVAAANPGDSTGPLRGRAPAGREARHSPRDFDGTVPRGSGSFGAAAQITAPGRQFSRPARRPKSARTPSRWPICWLSCRGGIETF